MVQMARGWLAAGISGSLRANSPPLEALVPGLHDPKRLAGVKIMEF
jgi:hypothetical protein